MTPTDCTVVGASFAGLACAHALARAGWRVRVAERKHDPGAKLHTTGILAKDAIDQVPLLDDLPASLVHRIDGVRLYAPSLRAIDLVAPGYFFLATDTGGVLRWLATRAAAAGADIVLGAPFTTATRVAAGFDLAALGATRYLVGADGPASTVARSLGLGRNARLLLGVEHEYDGHALREPGRLHCFLDRRLAPGYIGWALQGVRGVQVGLARRSRRGDPPIAGALQSFLAKITGTFDPGGRAPSSVRAGRIPCGGVVRPVATPRALLVGDAAGMVSPLTAGGIHTALKHGAAAAHAIGDFLAGRAGDPSVAFVRTYPRFTANRALRTLFDCCQSDLAFDLLLSTRAIRSAAGLVYFHRRDVFAPAAAAR
jgi:flavin-dependent dehydrogenase